MWFGAAVAVKGGGFLAEMRRDYKGNGRKPRHSFASETSLNERALRRSFPGQHHHPAHPELISDLTVQRGPKGFGQWHVHASIVSRHPLTMS